MFQPSSVDQHAGKAFFQLVNGLQCAPVSYESNYISYRSAPSEACANAIAIAGSKVFFFFFLWCVGFSLSSYCLRKGLQRLPFYNPLESADAEDVALARGARFASAWMLVIIASAFLIIAFVASGAAGNSLADALGRGIFLAAGIGVFVIIGAVYHLKRALQQNRGLLLSAVRYWAGTRLRLRVYGHLLLGVAFVYLWVWVFVPASLSALSDSAANIQSEISWRRKNTNIQALLAAKPECPGIADELGYNAIFSISHDLHTHDEIARRAEALIMNAVNDARILAYSRQFGFFLVSVLAVMLFVATVVPRVCATYLAFGPRALIPGRALVFNAILTLFPVLCIAYALDRSGVTASRPLMWILIGLAIEGADALTPSSPHDLQKHVYLVRTGTRFHMTESCPTLTSAEVARVELKALSEAERLGYTACRAVL